MFYDSHKDLKYAGEREPSFDAHVWVSFFWPAVLVISYLIIDHESGNKILTFVYLVCVLYNSVCA